MLRPLAERFSYGASPEQAALKDQRKRGCVTLIRAEFPRAREAAPLAARW